MKVGTICTHLEEAVMAGEEVDLTGLIDPIPLDAISEAFDAHGDESLSRVREALGENYDYEQLKIARAIRLGRS